MNLLITCPRRMEEDAAGEASALLGDMGDGRFEPEPTGISGIVWGTTVLDPLTVPRRAADMVREEPWRVRYIRRIIPMERTAATSASGIRDAVLPLASRMSPAQTYRITLEKRNSNASGREIIDAVAGAIPNRVSLENPDAVVQIEVLGGTTGVALIGPGGIFSLDVAKRGLSED